MKTRTEAYNSYSTPPDHLCSMINTMEDAGWSVRQIVIMPNKDIMVVYEIAE